MARITVEECLDHVDNRFELVMVGSKRARQIAVQGKEPMVPTENDKPTVLALREIEEGFIDASILHEQDEYIEEAPVTEVSNGNSTVAEEGGETPPPNEEI